jgi:hypothetical protein
LKAAKIISNNDFVANNLIIPDKIKDSSGNIFDILMIGNSAFGSMHVQNNNLTGSLTLSNSLQVIDDLAFAQCTGLTGELTISNTCTYVGSYAFYNCDFTGSLTIPNSVMSIATGAFRNCSGFTSLFFNKLTIPNSDIVLGNDIFQNCSGLSNDLPILNLTNIPSGIFSGCSNLTGELIISDFVKSIGDSSFYNCSGLHGELKIGCMVESIGKLAFAGTNLFGKVYTPNSLSSISYDAFDNCPNLEFFICNGAKYTFGYNAILLKALNPSATNNILNNCTTIVSYAFDFQEHYNNGIILIPSHVKYMGDDVFK